MRLAAKRPSTDSVSERIAQSLVIPPRPKILEQLSAELRREQPHLPTVAKLLSADVGLAAALLRTANSPAFGLRHKLVSVEQAITVLGFGTLEVLGTEVLLRGALGRTRGKSMERFWDASSKVAQVSRHIARSVPGLSADDAYLYGLFQDCGIGLLIQHFPDYKETLARANRAVDCPFTDVEQEHHQTDHATVGYLLARSWHLPAHLCEAIRFHHDPAAFGDGLVDAHAYRLIACALLADRCVQLLTERAQSAEWHKAGAAALECLDITAEEFAHLVDDVQYLGVIPSA